MTLLEFMFWKAVVICVAAFIYGIVKGFNQPR